MNAMNQIIIEGNVVRAPSVRETPAGKKVSILPIAVNHVYKDSTGKFVEDVGFFDVETWGDRFTDRIVRYGLQGRGVRVVGRLKQNRWKDDEGKSHNKVYILAEHVDFKPLKKKDAVSAAQSVESYQTADIPEEDTIAEEMNLVTAAQGAAAEAIF